MAGWVYFFLQLGVHVDRRRHRHRAATCTTWGAFKAVPQWTIALIAMVIVLTANTISVKLFGEMEFWAALRSRSSRWRRSLSSGSVPRACRFSIARRRALALCVIAGSSGAPVVQTRHRGAPSFLLFGTPYTSYATLVFLVAVTALMCYENYWNLVALVVIVPALVGGWYAVRAGSLEMARERVGFTGNYPSSPKHR